MNPTEVTERLLQCCPDDHRIDDPGVYALEIDLPDKDDAAEQWDVTFDERPPYWHRIVDCHTAIYVGAASDVQSRIHDHINGDVRKATLPSVFGVHWLREVRFYDDTDAAFEAEYNISRDIDRDTALQTYVHSR